MTEKSRLTSLQERKWRNIKAYLTSRLLKRDSKRNGGKSLSVSKLRQKRELVSPMK